MAFLDGVINKPEGDLVVDRCIEFEVIVEDKICKILVVRYCDALGLVENYGLKIHPDNPLESNEIQFAVFKKLYHALLAGIKDVDKSDH